MKPCLNENGAEVIELTSSDHSDSEPDVGQVIRPPSSRVKRPTYKIIAEAGGTDKSRLEKALEVAKIAQRKAEAEVRKIRKENKNLRAVRDAQKLEIERLQGEVKRLLGKFDKKNPVKSDAKSESDAKEEDMPKGRLTSVEYSVPKDEIRPDMALSDTGDTMGIAPSFDPDTEFDPGYNGMDDYGRTLGSPPRPENPNSQRQQSENLDRLPRFNSRSRSSVPADPAPNTTAVLIKREPTPEDVKKVAVAIKTEDAPDERGFVTFVKSEDGKLDIWNLDHLNLGPSLKVDEDLWVGFSRKVIADTLGGGHQECWLNWQGTEAKGIPYAAFNRSWNSELPRSPGQHGVVFATFRKFNDGTSVDRPIDFFVGENRNDWRYIGRYELGRRGEILPHQLELLPQNVVHNWAKGILKSNWGREWVDKTNEAIVETAELSGDPVNLIEFNTEGLRTALNDGRLVIGFTIMKCVGYRSEWHEQLLHYQAHPKPSKSQSKKRKSTGVSKGTPAKRLKSRSRPKASKDSDESHSEDGSDDYDGPGDDNGLEEGPGSVTTRSRRQASRYTSPEV